MRSVFLLLAILSCLVLVGCEDAQRTRGYRIVVIPKGMTHEFWQSIERGAKRAASDLTEKGVPTQVIWDGPLREQDSLAQIRIVDRRIATRVDGIVLAPQNSQTMVAPVERAVNQGIPVVIIDSGLAPEADPLIVKYIATDNEHGGYLAAEHLIKVINKPNPRLILFRYQVGSESTEKRERGFEKYIEEQEALGKLKVTWVSNDKYAGATKDSAIREAKPLVNRFRDDIDGIFAPNESSADGMREALRSVGLTGKVRLMGFDSSEPLLQAVEEGGIDGLILQDPYRMGYLSVYTLVRHLQGYEVSAGGKDYSTGEYLVTKENVNDQSTIDLFDPEWQKKRTIKPPEFLLSESLRQR